MKILIPMAGSGRRFFEAGYQMSKPAIPTYDKRTGEKKPMVVCATLDLPKVMEDGSNVIYVDRDFHHKDGTEDIIKRHFPKAKFISIDHLTDGQACTCMIAEEEIDKEEELLIAGCDNGMEMDAEKFESLKTRSDALVFVYRHNECVLENPDAHGWMVVNNNDDVTGISIKKAISNTPMEDCAVVATFWFRKGGIFMEAARKMIAEDDRINNEFYVDQTIKYVMAAGYRVKIFEIDRYIGWGTPKDYELFQKTYEYWRGFIEKERGRMV